MDARQELEAASEQSSKRDERPGSGKTELSRLREEVRRLEPWLQGPFVLGEDVIVEGAWRSDERWARLRPHLGEVAGKRVLDVGCNAGYDSFMFKRLGAEEVVGCDPHDFIEQARFVESVLDAGVRFERLGWQSLDPQLLGTFDVVHCADVLHHEPNPLGMIERLRSMLSEGGELLVSLMVLEDPALSEYSRFVRGEFAEDPNWWWIHGELAVRWMMDACGLRAEALPLRLAGPHGSFDVVGRYFRATAAAPDAYLPPSDPARVPHRLPAKWPLGHYYSPFPDLLELRSDPRRSQVWSSAGRQTTGIDWREQDQLALCRSVFAKQQRIVFPDHPPDGGPGFYAINALYPPLDAWILEGLLRAVRPRQMIEVGSGLSSLVTAQVNCEYLDCELRFTCIEPYPAPFLTDGVPGISRLLTEKVQDVDPAAFETLEDGDFLFIDTSHTVKTGGDVDWIYHQILPRLAPGVLVHLHDIFLPQDYPEDWVLDGWGWNELYLAQSFLAFNREFEIVLGAKWMILNHPEALTEAFPELPRYTEGSGSSLWIRRCGGRSIIR